MSDSSPRINALGTIKHMLDAKKRVNKMLTKGTSPEFASQPRDDELEGLPTEGPPTAMDAPIETAERLLDTGHEVITSPCRLKPISGIKTSFTSNPIPTTGEHGGNSITGALVVELSAELRDTSPIQLIRQPNPVPLKPSESASGGNCPAQQVGPNISDGEQPPAVALNGRPTEAVAVLQDSAFNQTARDPTLLSFSLELPVQGHDQGPSSIEATQSDGILMVSGTCRMLSEDETKEDRINECAT